jgi:ribonuclease E
MLETEPQNHQSESNESSANAGQAQTSGHEGSHRRGLLRRSRRGVNKPAGLPEFKSAVPEREAGSGQAGQQGTGQRTGSGAGPAGRAGQAAGAVPAVPGVAPSASDPGSSGKSGAGAQQQVPAAAFQPPVLVFQPPDLADGEQATPARLQAGQSEAEGGGGSSRRRRRGGRGRGKGGSVEGGADHQGGSSAQSAAGTGADQPGAADRGGGHAGDGDTGQATAVKHGGGKDSADAAAQQGAQAHGAGDGPEQAGDDSTEGEGGGSSSRRRRRRRQRSATLAAGGEVPAPDEPADTVVHIREPRPATEPDDVRAVKGSTRLEAKRQRRRDGRDTGRRRPPIISESEFLARREAVERVMVVRQQGDRTQIAVLEDGVLVEHYVDKASHQSFVGNVYLGKVQNVLPSMEAAFVDIGKGRNAVLYAGEVNFDASGLEGVAKRIESALKSGQSIMVQVTKDPIGHKGARLTSQISLPGRYLVYVPGASMTGISRKLPDTERNRLKQILKKVAPEEGGIIVRTAAEGASEEELQHDVTRLVAQWQAIERKAKTASAPDLLYSEPDLTIRVVRDIFNEDFTKLVIASDSEWDLVDEYVRYVAPTLADRLDRWADDKDLFAAYRIDEQIAKALDRKVWLPSGGSLVIDTTEAMTVIDVNTGKFTGQGGNLEQTVTRNNLEAAEEIVRQLRLRDIGGIIVIDFIDMVLESNRDLVLRRLIECLARDRTKHQVAEVTSLGLVQMTRKRVGSGLLAAFSVPCEHCNGRGIIVSTDLTDLPHAHGRNGQPAATPKPGPARSRSARSKAIAQVAAKTIESEAARPDGAATAPAEAGAPADTQAAAAATVEPESAIPEAAGPGVAVPESAAPESAVVGPGSDGAAPDRDSATAAAGAASVVSEAGQADLAAATEDAARRRPRRSARREAGPPDSMLAARTVTPAADALPADASAGATSASAPGDGPAATEAGEDQEAGGSPSASPAD